ncbi:kinase [Luteimonas aestuarii]|uniref:Kinase n=1 Tax=Luteimonas aestuarii TaxID=453837 RepID=A0A4R5U1E3_9GAMM|nr:kinase [Luteimonas aestuarii]TDK27391.1 kinase [Luteimonas aestuarii]
MPPAAHPTPPAGFSDDFVARVLDDALAHDTHVLGISGLQGTGKSTLAAQLVQAAASHGLRAMAVSLDDFYLDRPQRLRLARDVHPLLATRGPPGTHDVALACATLDRLCAGDAVRVPAFDKLADRRLPDAQWHETSGDHLVVFEGWCLGTPAQQADALIEPLNAVERDEDPDGTWRRWCNDALARDYPALWARIDRLLFLQPPGFDVVPDWRWQQEQSLQARDPSRTGMTRAQVERFVQHYERVSRQALNALPAMASLVVALDAERRPMTSSDASR